MVWETRLVHVERHGVTCPMHPSITAGVCYLAQRLLREQRLHPPFAPALPD